MNNQHKLLNANVTSLFFSYLLPTVIGMLTHSLYCLADVMFIGIGVGSAGLAAVNIAMPCFTIYTAIGLLIGVGSATTISICVGKSEFESVDKIFTMAVIMNLIAGVVLSILTSIFITDFCYLLGANDKLIEAVREYVFPVTSMSFLFIFSTMIAVIIRSDHNPKLVMIATVSGNCLNIFLDWLFVMVLDMGISGAAIATGVSPLLTIGLLSLHFLKHNNSVNFTRHFWDFALLKRIVQNGFATGILELTSGFIIYLFNISLLRISGDIAIAAYAVISNIAYVGKGVFNGISQAVQPLISTNYGAGQIKRSIHASKIAGFTAIGFASICVVLIYIFPSQIVSLFTNDPALIIATIPAIKIYFTSFVFTGINTIAMYYYQSIEKPVLSTGLSVMRGIVFVVIGILILPPFLGENGVWFTITFSEIASLVVLRFSSRLLLSPNTSS